MSWIIKVDLPACALCLLAMLFFAGCNQGSPSETEASRVVEKQDSNPVEEMMSAGLMEYLDDEEPGEDFGLAIMSMASETPPPDVPSSFDPADEAYDPEGGCSCYRILQEFIDTPSTAEGPCSSAHYNSMIGLLVRAGREGRYSPQSLQRDEQEQLVSLLHRAAGQELRDPAALDQEWTHLLFGWLSTHAPHLDMKANEVNAILRDLGRMCEYSCTESLPHAVFIGPVAEKLKELAAEQD